MRFPLFLKLFTFLGGCRTSEAPSSKQASRPSLSGRGITILGNCLALIFRSPPTCQIFKGPFVPGATFKAPYVMLLCYRALKGLFLLQEEAHLMYYYLVNGLSAAADAGLILRDCTPFNLPLRFLRSAKYVPECTSYRL